MRIPCILIRERNIQFPGTNVTDHTLLKTMFAVNLRASIQFGYHCRPRRTRKSTSSFVPQESRVHIPAGINSQGRFRCGVYTRTRLVQIDTSAYHSKRRFFPGVEELGSSGLSALLEFVDNGGLRGDGRGAAAIDCAISFHRIALSICRFFECGVGLWIGSVPVFFGCCVDRFGSAWRCFAIDEAAYAAGSRAGDGWERAVLCEESEEVARR